MPTDNTTDPTIGTPTGGTQPTTTTPTVPVAPVLPVKKQPTAQEYFNQQQAAMTAKPVVNTPAVPATTSTATPLTQQQINDKYKGNQYAQDRTNSSSYLDADLPFSGTNFKKAVYSAASSTNVNPNLLTASALEEGVGKLIDNPQKTSTDYNTAVEPKDGSKPRFDKNKYPVDGFYSFGLDNFSDNAQHLINKGLLPKNFASNYQKFQATNENGDKVNTAAFTTEDAALQAKAAMLADTRDNLTKYGKDNNIQLSPRQMDFFNLVGYNAGEGNMEKMIQSYKQKGLLNDDKFLTDNKFQPPSFPKPYLYAQRRMARMDMMNDQGSFSDYKAPNQPQTSINNQNRKDHNDFVDSKNPSLEDYIKQNPKTSLTPQMSGALVQDLNAHKEHLQNLVKTGQAVYQNGVTHDNVGTDTHKFSDAYMATTK